MQTKPVLRMGRIILLSIVIAILMASSLGGTQSVKGLGTAETYYVPGNFAKIQDCLNIVNPGDTCVISAGTYNEALVLKRSGTKDAPIRLVAEGVVTVNSGGNRTLVTSGNVHDWVIDGFRFITTGSGTSTDASINFSYNYWGDGHTGEKGNDRFTLRNCYVEGAVYFYGSENLVENCEFNGLGKWDNGIIERSQPSENNVFRNNSIHDYRQRGGWSLQFTVNSLWENNTIYNTSLMGIDCDGAGYPVHRCNLIGNTIYHIRGSNGLGVELENCFDCEMRGNHISDTNDALSIINYGPDITGDDVEYRDDPTRTIIENNTLENSNTGMICRGSPGGTFRNNLVRNTTQPAGYWGGVGLSNYGGFSCTDWTVTGNTFENNRFDWFVQAPSGFSLTANSNSYNNFTAKWNEVSISFSQWQAMGYDKIEAPTQTPISVTNTPIPTQVIDPATLLGLSWEAEQGQITAPFATTDGVVSQNTLTLNPADGGRALYRFIIQAAGDYTVKATVNAADAGSNSFFVGMDTEPDISMIWDVPVTMGFEERAVSWREGASPDGNTSNTKVFTLAPGEHTLIIRGREIGTLLDKVEVAKVLVVQPTNTVLPTVTSTQTPELTATPTVEVVSDPTAQPTITATPTATVTQTLAPEPTETATLLTYTALPSDTIPPTIVTVDITSSGKIASFNTPQLLITFSEDVGATGSDFANFGISGVSNGAITIDAISYDSNSHTTTLNINGGNLLPSDDYTILVTGTTSIKDLTGNKLDGNADGIGGDNFVHNFSVQPPTTEPPTATDTPVPASPTATATNTPLPTATPTYTATNTPTPTATSTNTPTATSVPPTPTAEPTSQPTLETVYDDTNSAFYFSPEWHNKYDYKAYEGSYKRTSGYGAFVTFDFTGQSFSVLYKSGWTYRALYVYVDGVYIGTINEQEQGEGFQRRWDYPGQLSYGAHTLKLVYNFSGKREKGSLDAVIVR